MKTEQLATRHNTEQHDDITAYVRDLLNNLHEREQGGLDVYQGTWISQEVQNRVAELAGPETSQQRRDGQITPEYMAVAKAVMTQIIEQCPKEDEDAIRFTVFDPSPNIADYVGGLREYLELLETSHDNQDKFWGVLVGSAANHYNFDNNPDLSKVLDLQNTPEQDDAALAGIEEIIRGGVAMGQAQHLTKNFIRSLYNTAKDGQTDDQRRIKIMQFIESLLTDKELTGDMIYQHEIDQLAPTNAEDLLNLVSGKTQDQQKATISEIHRRNRAEDLGHVVGRDLTRIEATREKAAEIAANLGNITGNIHDNIQHLFGAIDNGEFAQQLIIGVNEQIIYIQKIAARILEYGRAGGGVPLYGEVYYKSIEELESDLDLLQRSYALLFNVLSDKKLNVSRYNVDSSAAVYMFESSQFGRAKMYIRQYGKPPRTGYDRNTEYSTARYGVEASISFSVNPDNPQDLEYYKKDGDISILRLDREGRAPNADPADQETRRTRDSSANIGTISIDIGSAFGGKNVQRIGRLVSLANAFKVEDHNRHEQQITKVLATITSDAVHNVEMLRATAHHNDSSFDQAKYGTAAGFARLAGAIKLGADQIFAERLNQDDPNLLLNPDKAIETARGLQEKTRAKLRHTVGHASVSHAGEDLDLAA